MCDTYSSEHHGSIYCMRLFKNIIFTAATLSFPQPKILVWNPKGKVMCKLWGSYISCWFCLCWVKFLICISFICGSNIPPVLRSHLEHLLRWKHRVASFSCQTVCIYFFSSTQFMDIMSIYVKSVEKRNRSSEINCNLVCCWQTGCNYETITG